MDKRDLARFLSKVDQYEFTDMCWLWTASKQGLDYGGFKYRGKWWLAHRWSYTYFFGEIPEGLEIDHLCKVKLCVNPYHLEAVTRAVNNLRKGKPGPRKTHCPQGHEYTEENTYVYTAPSGYVNRRCRICKRTFTTAPKWMQEEAKLERERSTPIE
jgi:hypothetical protein